MGRAEPTSALIRRLAAVLRDAQREPAAREVEALLADGYAGVFALEAERSRIERQIAEAFADSTNSRAAAGELRALSARMLQVEYDIARLRSLLEELRDFARTVAPVA